MKPPTDDELEPDGVDPSADADAASAAPAAAEVAPDTAEIREALKETLASRQHQEEGTRKAFEYMVGTATPSSVVPSAESFTLFAGLAENGNGALDLVALQALTAELGEIDPKASLERLLSPKRESDPPEKT
jgi:hypothetical protein